ncbi:armadillo-like helical domain-containing protein 4 isoform X3 [Pongo abelii]|uniref:armadillo-like helical domain-containing protein 4 isoform X3 n=1 Tax=Pongo abelii TaxID=9601 RepID=UPI0030044B17
MSGPIVLHICLAFCSLLLFNIATQCLAFPKIERREIAHVHAEKGQSDKMNTDDLENSSITSKQTPQLVVSEDPMMVSAGPSATTLNKAFSINKETQSGQAGLMQTEHPGVSTATESGVPSVEEVFGSSQPERISPESGLAKAMLTIAITVTPSLTIDEKEELLTSTNFQPIVEETTETTKGFLKYMDNQSFATESQEGVGLGHSPSSYVNTKEMLTTNPKTEKFEADTDHRATSFPGAESTAGTEPGGLTPDKEKPSQMTADNTQAAATKQPLETSEDTLSVEPETDSLLDAPEVTVSVSTAVPAASALSDEWDDTKLESVSQIRTPKLGDNEETQVRTEMSQTAQVSHEGVEGGQPWTEAAELALGLPEGEAHMGTALLIAHGNERSPAFTDQSSFTPTSLIEDMEVSIVNLLQSTGDFNFTESTKENDALFFLETTVSVSEYESEADQLLGNTMKEQMDTVTGPNEEFTPVLGSPVTSPGIMVEEPSISPALPASEASSERRTVIPYITHVNTAASYGLDQLESEEGEEDEDEEDEEDEDEEEENEEEDEEDKDKDSLDEGLDGDAELPGFTLPGITSQEPGLEEGNMDLLEGATYQVPDALEWEQQNQGLVRSWMEKLKDKAGYMSGMLVPVGVGIAGALFILGALYSIKVMNRRRRNGFKRHKRKQREFNSMQDRVMLLADSSEDEF